MTDQQCHPAPYTVWMIHERPMPICTPTVKCLCLGASVGMPYGPDTGRCGYDDSRDHVGSDIATSTINDKVPRSRSYKIQRRRSRSLLVHPLKPGRASIQPSDYVHEAPDSLDDRRCPVIRYASQSRSPLGCDSHRWTRSHLVDSYVDDVRVNEV